MIKRLNRAGLFAFIFIIVSLTCGHTARAEYEIIQQNTTARVLQIIDGDALKVAINGSDQIALVRLAGIATQGNNDAFAYMAEQLLGRDVELKLDTAISGMTVNERWTPVYVYYKNNLYNRILLQKGMAYVDGVYGNISLYNTFLNDERIARGRSLGLWAADTRNYTSASLTSYAGYGRVNINLATASQLQNSFTDLSLASARAIVSYREYAPYRTVREIKFADALTREQYETYAGAFVVCTNINTASSDELRMAGFTLSEARAVIKYRNDKLFTDIYQLYTANIVSGDKYDELSPYLDIYDLDTIDYAIPDKVADLNRDTAETLNTAGAAAGLTASKARMVADNRTNSYTYKSVGEIQKISGIKLTNEQINRMADNLRPSTAYNSMNVPAYTNINAASPDVLLGAGFTQNQAAYIAMAQSRGMRCGAEIPFDLGSLGTQCTLYTNINLTTAVELLSLSDQMTPYFASVLVNAADRQPFGSMDELALFFADYDESKLYNRIKDYIVLR